MLIDDHLPSRLIRALDGLCVQRTDAGQNLTITMPTWMVPLRRYAQVHISRSCYRYIIDIVHEEVFTNATVGRNAWQSSNLNRCLWHKPDETPYAMVSNVNTETRRLDRKTDQIRGMPKTLTAFLGRMQGKFWHRDLAKLTHVQVMPEGFRIYIYDDTDRAKNAMTGIGHYLTAANKEALTGLISKAHHHGGARERSSTSVPMPPNATYDYQARGRGSATTTIPHNPNQFNQEGDSTMQKIDTTTNLEVPFDTSNTKIVKAVFQDGAGNKDYAYYADETLKDLQPGDFAVVVAPHGQLYDEKSKGYVTTVRIVSLDEDLEGVTKAAKWIVQRIDMDGYRDRIAKADRIRLLDARIETAKREAMKRVELQKLMDASPELAELIKERLELSAPPAEATATVSDAVVEAQTDKAKAD